MGNEPLGRIIFSQDGYMSALGNDPERMKRIDPKIPWTKAGDDVLAHVSRSLMGYWGNFRVVEQDGGLRLATVVQVSADPSWMGTEQVRKLKFKEEEGKELLVLSPVDELTTIVSSLKF